LKKITPSENIVRYIKHLLSTFEKHAELGRVLKQIVVSFAPEFICPFQEDIMVVVNERMLGNQRNQTKV
jgi:hypothetical protein